MMKMYRVAGFTAIVLALLLTSTLHALGAGVVTVGSPITDNVILLDMTGKDADLKAMMNGRETLLVFFNTVCSNCIAELSYLDSLYEPKKSPVHPIAIGVDIGGPKVLAPFAEARKFRYPILSDADARVPGIFGLSFTPASVLVGADGKVKGVFTGYSQSTKDKITALFP